MQNEKLRALIEGAIMIALGQALSQLPTAIPVPPPVGPINFSIGMIPIIVFAIRRGLKYGLFVGLGYGLSNFLIGDLYWLHFVQGMIEYTIPYFCLGVAGLFTKPVRNSIEKNQPKRRILYLVSASVVAVLARYFWHFVAGVWFWGSFAPEGMNPYTYSFIVNFSDAAAGIFATIVVLLLLSTSDRSAKRLLVPKP